MKYSRILQVDPRRLRFLDEAHFVSGALDRQQTIGPRGTRTIIVRNKLLFGQERLTLTLLAGIDEADCTCWGSVTTSNNTAENFFEIIKDAIRDGYLRAGHILVLDNASVRTLPYVLVI